MIHASTIGAVLRLRGEARGLDERARLREVAAEVREPLVAAVQVGQFVGVGLDVHADAARDVVAPEADVAGEDRVRFAPPPAGTM